MADTLKKHPIFNSSLDEVASEIVLKEYIHLGIAVDTDQGLMVPVIRDVDKKSMFDLAKELEALAAKARDRKISADEMKGGTFTISNQGRDWRRAFYADHQSAGGRHPRPRSRYAQTGRARWQNRGAPDDADGVELRSSRGGRRQRGAVHGGFVENV